MEILRSTTSRPHGEPGSAAGRFPSSGDEALGLIVIVSMIINNAEEKHNPGRPSPGHGA